jgi:hypothetical protein
MRLRTWGIAGLFIWFAASAGAQEATMRLKDGTVLKGTRIEKQEGHWVLESPTIGKVLVKEEDVQVIEVAAAPSASKVDLAPLVESAKPPIDKAAVAKKVLSDPTSMVVLMNIAKDPEITEMLSDPAFRQAVQSFDMGRLQKDPRFLKFIERSDVQEVARRAAEGSVGNEARQGV